jgi:hypothetical protein
MVHLACHSASPCKFGLTNCAIVGSVVGEKANLHYHSVVEGVKEVVICYSPYIVPRYMSERTGPWDSANLDALYHNTIA